MKKLYTFVVNETTEQNKEVKSKDANNQDITIISKEKIDAPKTYFIRKPNRQDFDEADFFYDKLFSENVKAGILTRSEIIKKFADEDFEIKKIYDNYVAKETELQRLNLQEKTEDNINRKNRLEQDLLSILVEIQNFEINKSSIFDRTAENRSRAKTIFWWILNLSYKQDGDKEVPLFYGKTYEEKVSEYDGVLEKENTHLNEVIQKFHYFISSWYTGKINTQKDFDKAEKLLQAEIKKAEIEKQKQVKEEEVNNQPKSVTPEETSVAAS